MFLKAMISFKILRFLRGGGAFIVTAFDRIGVGVVTFPHYCAGANTLIVIDFFFLL